MNHWTLERHHATNLRRTVTTIAVLCAVAIVSMVAVSGQPRDVRAAPGNVVVNETFSGSTVSDPLIRATGAACLSGASSNTAQLNACPVTQTGPVPVRTVTPGYLQLTDAAVNKGGAVFYNRPIPSGAGIDATFELSQYGGTGADGITFFLVDGATQLTATGGLGGSLGYAQRYSESGIAGGYLGIGFDVFGNYYNDNENRGTGCPPGQRSPAYGSTGNAPNTITVRGPGQGAVGYCYLTSTTVAGTPASRPTSSLPGKLSATTLATSRRTVHVAISAAASPTMTISVDFHDGNGPRTVVNALPTPPNMPSTVKFGFSGSTGGTTDVHLLRNLVVSTVVPLESLNLVKQVDRQSVIAPVLVAGATIPYQFVVTNNGLETLHGLTINDPAVGAVTCPTANIPPAPDPTSTVVCTGTHVVTAGDVASGQVVNVATATALSPSATLVTSNPDTVTVPLRSTIGLSTGITTAGPYRIGQSVAYSYVATNTGNAALSNVSITDTRATGISCPVASLEPAATVTCTGSYVVRLQDLATNGTLTKSATASGTSAIGQRAQSSAVALSIPVAADLSLSKSVDRTEPLVGETVVYTVTVRNDGPSAARSVVVSDPTAIGTTTMSAVATIGTYSSTTGLWTIPALAVGESAVLTGTSRIDVANAIVNGATVTDSEQPDLNPGSSSGSVTLNPITPTTDLAVLTSFDRDAIRVGDTIVATLTLNNEGPFSATGVTVRDPLPSGMTFVSATGAGSYDPDSGIWSIGDVPYPGTATIRISAVAVTPGFAINTVSLATVTPADINPLDDVATAAVTVDKALADLALSTSVRPANATTLGSGVDVTISATNNGSATAPAVVVDDALSGGLTLVSALADQGSFDAATGVWSVGALAPGATATLELVTTATALGHQSNNSTITDDTTADPDGSNNSSSVSVLVGPAPIPPADVGISKQVTPAGDVSRGTVLTFTMTASNSGPNAATGVVFADPLPAGLELVSANPSSGTSYDAATGLWSVGSIAVGAEPTLTISARVVSGAGDYSNSIALVQLEQPDTDAQDDSASVGWRVRAEADLSVTKTVSPTTAGPGDTVTFTVGVTNSGPEPDTGVQLVETNRTPAVFTSIVASKGSFDAPSRVWTIGDLAVGETATIVVQVLITTPEHVVNRTVVFAADLPDPDLADNEATAALDVPGADLSVTKTVDDANPVVGSPVTFSVGVTNQGPDTASAATVVDQLPSGLDFSSASATVGTYYPATGIWSIGDMLPGDSATLTLVAMPTSNQTLTNSAEAAADGPPDFDPSDNIASATVTARTSELAVTKTVSTPADGDIRPGDDFGYTVTVANTGTAPAAVPTVADTLPAMLTFVSSPEGCTATGQLVTCEAAAIAPGASTSVGIVVRLDPAYDGDGADIVNTATATATTCTDVCPASTPATPLPDGVFMPVEPAPPIGPLPSGGAGLKFVPITPTRALDTRQGGDDLEGPRVPAGATVSFGVIGGQVPADAKAVALNLTTTSVEGAGYATAWPAGQAMPPTSSVNVSVAGETAANATVLLVGAGGEISVFTFGTAHLIADVTGYWIDAADTTDGRLHPVAAPARFFDSRDGTGGKSGSFARAEQFDLQVTGAQVPVDATAVVLTVTYTNPTQAGFITTWPTGEQRPNVSTTNPNGPGDTRSNLAIVEIGVDGSVSIYSSEATDVVIDVVAYFADGDGTVGLFTPLSPERIADTRSAGGPFGRLPAESTSVLSFTPFVPDRANFVLYNLTATNTATSGYVTAHDSDESLPAASSVNWSDIDQNRAAFVGTSRSRTSIDYYAYTGTDLIVDLAGWFT